MLIFVHRRLLEYMAASGGTMYRVINNLAYAVAASGLISTA
jgi:hypothetical protein